MERNRKGSPYSSDYSVHHCSPSKWFLSSVSRRSTMPKARPLASQYPVLKVRAAGRFGAARQGDILPYPGRRGGRLSRPPRFLHIRGTRGIARPAGGFPSRPITKYLGSYGARPDVVTEPRTTGPEMMAVHPERGQQNTWEWISARRNPGTARQRDEGAFIGQ